MVVFHATILSLAFTLCNSKSEYNADRVNYNNKASLTLHYSSEIISLHMLVRNI